MAQTITIGLDLAKQVFQVHGVDAAGAGAVHPITIIHDVNKTGQASQEPSTNTQNEGGGPKAAAAPKTGD